MENTLLHKNTAPKVTVVILNYNGWCDTLECLESVLKLAYLNFDIVVVDNHSPNNSCDQILRWTKGELIVNAANTKLAHLISPASKKPLSIIELTASEPVDCLSESKDSPTLYLIRANRNGGFAAGNNIGLQFAIDNLSSEYVWLLNNDTVVEKNALEELVTCHTKSTKIGILGSKLLYYHKPDTIQAVAGKHNKWLGTTAHIGAGQEDNGQFDSLITSDYQYIVGASIFVSRSFINDVGLLKEDYFLYFEELDWCIRAKQHGWQIGVCPTSRVYHKEGASINLQEKKSELADYYSIRNRLLITRRFFPFAVPLVYLSMIGVALNRLRKGQPKRLKLVFKAIFGS